MRVLADVRISRIPQNLVGAAFVENQRLNLVFYRWDKFEWLGWKPFTLTVQFPGSDEEHKVSVPSSHNLKDRHSFKVNLNVVERPLQTGRKIPRLVWNLSAPLTKQPNQKIRKALENIREINRTLQCTCDYRILEDDDALKEVRNSSVENFLQAYNSLKSGAYKADLVRYWLLYKYGGVYFDDKTIPRYSLDSENFDRIFINNDTGDSCDFFIGVSAGTVEIAFLGARPGSPIMLLALESAIDNIIQRRYTDHRLGITGNRMLQKILNGKVPRTTNQIHWTKYEDENIVFVPIAPSDEKIIFDQDIFWQRQPIDRSDWPRTKTHYSNLWNQRQIFTDGNPSPLIPQIISTQTKREILAYTIFILVVLGIGFLISSSSL